MIDNTRKYGRYVYGIESIEVTKTSVVAHYRDIDGWRSRDGHPLPLNSKGARALLAKFGLAPIEPAYEDLPEDQKPKRLPERVTTLKEASRAAEQEFIDEMAAKGLQAELTASTVLGVEHCCQCANDRMPTGGCKCLCHVREKERMDEDLRKQAIEGKLPKGHPAYLDAALEEARTLKGMLEEHRIQRGARRLTEYALLHAGQDSGPELDLFDKWMEDVDAEVEHYCGMSIHDLADQPYRDWFDDGVRAKTAARRALEDEGYPF